MANNLSFFNASLDYVVGCLCDRYSCILGPKIYTNFGSILVAVNPVYLTTDEYAHIYGQNALSNADAHIYAVAKRAVDMLRPNSQETIVVIGDSGSGKTVTVGHVLDYLTATSHSPKCEAFFQKIVGASHLMELFANAQTCLNTNSSRFGKLISLVYSCGVAPQLEGAEVEAFLLEKSRVTSTPEPGGSGENFHMLRLLVSKVENANLFERIFEFRKKKLVSGEFSFRVAPYRPDLEEQWHSFERARQLLSTFGFEDENQLDIFRTLAVILHLCNLEFIARDEALGCELAYHLPNVHTSLLSLQSLLSISDCRDIQQVFTTKPVSATQSRRQSVYRKPCGVAESEGRRNSVARLLYSQLFEYIMQRVSASVAPDPSASGSRSQISVLDIFGFESFVNARNDFEQLCINFCNEKIQQHFARICISDVSKELAVEGLSSDQLGEPVYSDNEAVLAIFESVPAGIFSVLDEKCRLNRTPFVTKSNGATRLVKAHTFSSSSPSSSASSDDFFQTLCGNFRGSGNKCIKFSRTASCQFTIFHYAGPVVYSCENFVEKSRDDVSPDLVAFFSLSIKNKFVASLVTATKPKCDRRNVAALTPQPTNESTVTVRKRSLAAKYRSATASLVSFLGNSTNVHYVRCIRPNSRPANAQRSISDRSFDRDHVATQLASAGLVEVLRLANATGKFSRRFSYRAFATGFSIVFYRLGTDFAEEVVDDTDENKENATGSVSTLKVDDKYYEMSVRDFFFMFENVLSRDEFFFGKTKIFLSDPVLMFFRRLQHLIERCAASRIQRCFRRYSEEAKQRRLLEQAILEEADTTPSPMPVEEQADETYVVVSSPLSPGRVEDETDEVEAVVAPPPSSGRVEDETDEVEAVVAPPPSSGCVEDETDELNVVVTPPPSSGQIEETDEFVVVVTPPQSSDRVEGEDDKVAAAVLPATSLVPVEEKTEETAVGPRLSSPVCVEEKADDVAKTSPPPYSCIGSEKTKFFIDGDIISRRRLQGCGLFWFHVKPNPVLHGAHVINRKLLSSQASLTDCLD